MHSTSTLCCTTSSRPMLRGRSQSARLLPGALASAVPAVPATCTTWARIEAAALDVGRKEPLRTQSACGRMSGVFLCQHSILHRIEAHMCCHAALFFASLSKFLLPSTHWHSQMQGSQSLSLLYHREGMIRRLWWMFGLGQAAAIAACEAADFDCNVIATGAPDATSRRQHA